MKIRAPCSKFRMFSAIMPMYADKALNVIDSLQQTKFIKAMKSSKVGQYLFGVVCTFATSVSCLL